MGASYVISRMSKEEMPLAIAWAEEQGWNPGIHDSECFYQTDPKGFFAGKLDGKIIAIGSAVVYDEDFAFCGFYIVDKAFRDHGYGLALTKARLAYVGSRNVGIDGVVPMLKKYEQLGYKLAYHNARYRGVNFSIKAPKTKAVVALSEIPFLQLVNYDRQHFPAKRDTFLRCWINQRGSKSLGYLKDGQLLGYGVIRPCFVGFKIGPLFADNPNIAEELFLHLIEQAKDQPIYLDIPECNKEAVQLTQHYQLEKVFETARMYLKEAPEVKIAHIYGITSFELG